ncbi:50S ribosomal protein L25/general stress protein Ctc [Dysgonomonas sp. 216]|uniref:50S ribosomal protein L25/general stress protein Ctc n=1 Tax=Dysgonomonas sp. 216 TaxID=2302934 RepID=UPI0013D8C7BB|nr:50S ribosomal protein L25/general stress protein Ctc [Dysgonomonas sp. 216]NDW18869.1 50S ribosomal protein L25/general stress protein Ctc [Dysgonomonas sp. 216]
MKSFELNGSARTILGKKGAKAARKENLIPAVLYGGESTEAKHFSVSESSVRNLIYTPEIYLVNLSVDGQVVTAILKDIQFHPVTDNILHIDFLQVFDNKPIVIEVPVVLEGLAEGVKAGGKLSLDTRKLKVRAMYKDIPEKLHVNIEHLALGKSIQVGELSFDGLELLNAKNSVVCRVQLTRAARGLAAKNAGK